MLCSVDVDRKLFRINSFVVALAEGSVFRLRPGQTDISVLVISNLSATATHYAAPRRRLARYPLQTVSLFSLALPSPIIKTSHWWSGAIGTPQFYKSPLSPLCVTLCPALGGHGVPPCWRRLTAGRCAAAGPAALGPKLGRSAAPLGPQSSRYSRCSPTPGGCFICISGARCAQLIRRPRSQYGRAVVEGTGSWWRRG